MYRIVEYMYMIVEYMYRIIVVCPDQVRRQVSQGFRCLESLALVLQTGAV